MSLRELSERMLPPIEAELQRQVARLDAPSTKALHEMLTYHMGWTGDGSGRDAIGKRIRPFLVLLSAAAWSENWTLALPAAAGIEIVHNFSLVHDDIQDHSETRRGRPALWTMVGVPMAINVGDALFAIAHLAVLELGENIGADLAARAATILQQACLDLTRGQYLDLAFQRKRGLTLEDYWTMIEGKTAALLAAGAEIGCLIGSRDTSAAQRMKKFGRLLGLAFQVQDDILGIWGDQALLGKSTASDLIEGKSSLPVLYAVEREPEFAERWLAAPLRPEDVVETAQLIKDCGGYDYAVQEGQRLTDEALTVLAAAGVRGEAGEALRDLTQQLLGRGK